MRRRSVGAMRVAACLVGIATIASDQQLPVSASAAGNSSATRAQLPERSSITAMSCPATVLCFAVGDVSRVSTHQGLSGLLARTADSAETWTIHQTSGNRQLSGIACPSSRQCYAIGDHPGAGGAGVGAIFRTQDGGQTWQQSNAPFQNRNVVAGLWGIACPGLTTCLIPATIGVRGANVPGKNIVLITRDGGRTWSRKPIGVGSITSHRMIACPTILVCYVYGTHGTGTAIAMTRDGGKSWRLLPGTNMLARSGIGPAYDLARSVACPTVRVCYTADGDTRPACAICKPSGIIFGTRDGGAHWHLLYLRRQRDFLVGSLVCPGTSVCYVVGVTGFNQARNEFILTTKNAGQTWTKHMVPAGQALACPSINVCYVAVRFGRTSFRTRDGGTTWRAVP